MLKVNDGSTDSLPSACDESTDLAVFPVTCFKLVLDTMRRSSLPEQAIATGEEGREGGRKGGKEGGGATQPPGTFDGRGALLPRGRIGHEKRHCDMNKALIARDYQRTCGKQKWHSNKNSYFFNQSVPLAKYTLEKRTTPIENTVPALDRSPLQTTRRPGVSDPKMQNKN